MKKNTKKIMLSAVMTILTAPYALALDLPAFYKEASAPWSAEQAVKLPSVLTPEVLTEIGEKYGAAAGQELADKKEKVSALVDRFRTCGLNEEDLKTAEKHLDKEFKEKVAYFASYGCKVVMESPADVNAAGSARPALLGGLEELSASPGSGESYSRFFDGSGNIGRAPEAVMGAAAGPEARLEPGAPVKRTTLVSKVTSLISRAGISKPDPDPVPGINEAGRLQKAVNYLTAMRKRNWKAVKSGELNGVQKAEAEIKAAGAFGLATLLKMTNLPRAEKAGIRLRRDISQGARGRVIIVDALKLAFHSGVVVVGMLPISIGSIVQGAMNGSPWAIAQLAARTAGPVNNYLLHFAD